jgi:hypothetical protein
MVSGSVDTMACHVLIVGDGEDLLTYHLHNLNIKDCYICGVGSELDIYKKLPLCIQDLSGFK